MRKSALTLVMLVTATVIVGCRGAGNASTAGTTSGPVGGIPGMSLDADGVYRLHDRDVGSLGLKVFWTQKLYADERVIDAYLLGDRIIMETAGRRLYGMARTTGAMQWMVDVPNRCDFRACTGSEEDYMYVPCRSSLIAIDKGGDVIWRRLLSFAPGGMPVADETHVYLPCYDGRMRAFLKDKGYFAWQYTTGGELQAQPAIGSKLVYAGSNDGFVYALTTEKLDLSWSYKTYDRICAGIIFNNRRVYAASTDGNLYCLVDMPQATREQQLAWPRPYASGAAIETTPYVKGPMVLVVNRNRECHAVDTAYGRKLWVVADVDRVLTQGRLNTYLLKGSSRIVAADNKTGLVRWVQDITPGAYSFVLTNTMDDVIYLVKDNGETQAIRESAPIGPAPVEAPPAPPAVPPAAEPAPAPEPPAAPGE